MENKQSQEGDTGMKKGIGLLVIIVLLVSGPAYGQFEKNDVTIGLNGGYTMPTAEFNNWFDGTAQGAAAMTVGFSPSTAYELRVSWGKFDRTHDVDFVETNPDRGDGSIDWNYNFGNFLQYVSLYNNLLYRPWSGQGGAENVYLIAGLSLTRWEYDRDAFTFIGWDNHSRKESTQEQEKLNRNGYHAGVNLGAGIMLPIGSNLYFDAKVQYEAFFATLWPFLLVDLDQAGPLQFFGFHAGLRIGL